MPGKQCAPVNKKNEKSLKDVAESIVASYNERVKVVQAIIEDTHNLMDFFRRQREEMSQALRETLARFESLRKKDFDRMMGDIVARQNEREQEVKIMLESFRKEEEVVAEKLKNLLRKGGQVRISDFKKIMSEIQNGGTERMKDVNHAIGSEIQKMREEVHVMLANFKQERQSVAQAWHEVINLFHKDKHGKEDEENKR